MLRTWTWSIFVLLPSLRHIFLITEITGVFSKQIKISRIWGGGYKARNCLFNACPICCANRPASQTSGAVNSPGGRSWSCGWCSRTADGPVWRGSAERGGWARRWGTGEPLCLWARGEQLAASAGGREQRYQLLASWVTLTQTWRLCFKTLRNATSVQTLIKKKRSP